MEKNITATILEKCQVNQLYIVGKIEETFESPNYFIEILDIENINDLRYLVGLSKKIGGVNSMIEIGKVITSTPGLIQVMLNGIDTFEINKSKIRISRYVVIEDGNNLKILASIQNISAVQSDAQTISYTLSCSPIGCYSEGEEGIDFRQGGVNLPSPTEPVYIPEDDIINAIFSGNDSFSFI